MEAGRRVGGGGGARDLSLLERERLPLEEKSTVEMLRSLGTSSFSSSDSGFDAKRGEGKG
jgi:hypothetical protein